MPSSWEDFISSDAADEAKAKALEMVKAACGCAGTEFERDDVPNSIACVQRSVYRYTACGAYCEFDFEEGTVILGSIVEGVDWGTDNHELVWPFTRDDWNRALDEVEDEAKSIWHDTHGCPECARLLGIEYVPGQTVICLECGECDGQGEIV